MPSPNVVLPPIASLRPSRIRWRVLAWLCAIAAIAYFQRNSIAVTKEPLAKELGLDAAHLSPIIASFYLGYALFQIPGGLLRDLWGTRATLTIVVLGASLATALMALVVDQPTATFAWLAAGAFQAALFPCAVSAIRQWFPATERATASGALASFMSLGGAAATGLSGYLLVVTDWRGVFAWFALPGALWALAFGLLYRSRPQWQPGVNEAELKLIRGEATAAQQTIVHGSDDELRAARETSVASVDERDEILGPTPWLAILFTPALLALYAQQFLRAGGQVFYGTWFPTYLQQARSVDLAQSGALTSLPQIAIMVGSLLGGYLSDRLLRRTSSHWHAYQLVSIVSLSLCAALIVASFYVSDATAAVVMISIGSFCGAVAGPAAYAVSIAKGGQHVATVFSVMNMAGNIGATLLPWGLPWLADAWGWDNVLFSFAGLFAAAAICWWFISAHGTVDDSSRSSPEHA